MSRQISHPAEWSRGRCLTNCGEIQENRGEIYENHGRISKIRGEIPELFRGDSRSLQCMVGPYPKSRRNPGRFQFRQREAFFKKNHEIMKKILSMAAIALTSAVMFTACEDDRDSNPTLTQPTSFVLNKPAVGEGVVDLALSKTIGLTWSQPTGYTDLEAPVVATYSIQISKDGKFETAYDAEADDNSGADYIVLDETTTSCTYALSASDVATALQKINLWEEDAVPAIADLYLRVKSVVRDASANEYFPIVSNPVSMKVAPYYVELKDATPIMWYLVGNMFGGNWGSSVGVDAFPMFLTPGYEYDKKTGTGIVQYLNYFLTDTYKDNGESDLAGWKIQPADFNWDKGMTGNGGKKGEIIYRNGGDDGGHILAPENGYYLVTMDTKTMTAKMEKQDITPTVLSSMGISGAFNGWTDEPMLPYNTEGVENHAWYYVLEVTPGNCSEETPGFCDFKFRPNGEWKGYGSVKNAVNYVGVAGDGENLALPIGKYCISYNDITSEFSIVAIQ